MSAGRPSDYSIQLVGIICQRIALGESLKSICASDGMPNSSTIFRWLAVHEEFRDMYARAREEQTNLLADELLDIADDARNDWMERLDRNGKVIGMMVDREAIDRSRLRVDTRKWLLAKLQPRKYGDKLIATDNEGRPLALGLVAYAAEQAVRPGNTIQVQPAALSAPDTAGPGSRH